MKKLVTIFVGIFFSISLYSQNDTYTFEWISKIKIDTLATIGHKHMYVQYCLPEIDTNIVNGIIIHSNAEVMNIPNCRYEIYLTDTIITKIIITTSNKESTIELKKLVTQLFLNFELLKLNKKQKYCLTDSVFNGTHCILLYIEEKKMKKGKFIIKLLNS
ncbi:MAG: hypothetical protein ACP5DZ_10020 [Bacteroidales bacterium]